MCIDTCQVFTSGCDGYHTYRIPALLAAGDGTLLAFCEGRLHDGGDHGAIHLLLKQSADGGRNWSPQQIVWADGPNTCGNPCPVQDPMTGVIRLLANWNRPGRRSEDYFTAYDARAVCLLSSEDGGRTWSAPLDITRDVKREHWGWYATGPCTGIALRHGQHAGRLVIPCNHSTFDSDPVRLYSHVICSDDGGQHWRIGGISPCDGYDECQAAELPDGRLVLNMRHYAPEPGCRGVAVSADGGDSWEKLCDDAALIEGAWGCQGSLAAGPNGGLLFANPASQLRECLTVRHSGDGGGSWSTLCVLHAGPAAYSSLALLPDSRAACLYECGDGHPYETITFAAFRIDR